MARNYRELYDEWEANMLQDADNAITECNLWDWMREFTPNEGEGFMFAVHPNLARIDAAMKYDGHSGFSYAWTMRTMEYIAKKGWKALYDERMAAKKTERVDTLNPLQIAQALRNVLPDGEKQYQGMSEFMKGGLTYAEMRERCG